MSVEAMSVAPAVGIAPAINTGPAISSFGREFSGGTHQPGFDNAALFNTFQMPMPSLNSSDGGINNTVTSPFENTQVLWQAEPAIAKPTSIQELPINEIKLSNRVIQEINDIPDVVVKPEVQSLIQESFSEPEIKIGLAIPAQTQNQEFIADVKQAIAVENALVATGTTTEEAHETALRILTEKQDKGNEDQTLVKEKDPDKQPEIGEIHFEHDEKADEARKKAAIVAIDNIVQEFADKEMKIVTGHDIAEHMPDPEPQEVKSEIAKDRDGSYESLIAELKAIGEISSTTEAGEIIDELIDKNHAVRTSNVLRTQSATEQEIQKVLSGKEITIFQT